MKVLVPDCYKFKLQLNKKQKEQCVRFGGICRYVWNKLLEKNIEKYEKEKSRLSEFSMNKLLTEWKKKRLWLKKPPSQALQQISNNLNKAYENFFRGEGFPRFKRKGGKDSFRLPQGFKLLPQLSRKVGVIQLPKLGKVRYRQSQKVKEEVRNITIVREGEEWFISFMCLVEMEIVLQKKDFYIVAIDRGITISLKLSDGKTIKLQKPLRKNLDKLNVLMRKLSNKEKGSSNWWKVKRKIQKLFRHMKNKRKDELHKITTHLANNHGMVVLEALNTKNMMKSARGTIENPGKNVKAKSGLNRSIADEAWNLLERLLEYKMERRGGKVVYVDPKHTSQQCSKCKHISKNNRKSQSCFECEKCGYKANADFNASKNILNRYLEAAGHAVTACGRRTKVLSLNQELANRKPATTSKTRAPV